MFSNGLKESYQKEINLTDVDDVGLSALLKFMYIGN